MEECLVRSFSDLRAGFRAPGARFSPIPFWFLNGDMDREELERQLRLMDAVGIGAVVLHARHGHTVPYLSEEWFAGIRHCVEVCATLGMKAWLYDEDNFPSGYAGGATLAAYPGGRAKHLCLVAQPQEDDTIVHTAEEGVFVMRPTPWRPAYSAADWYTDLMDPRATEAFIESTHERYAQALGDHLGTTVTAVFTDEPGFYNHFHTCAPDTVVWTPDMLDQFEARRGYSLQPYLKLLFADGPEAPRIRCDFYQTVTELIVERFYLPLKRWCNCHGMESVGHVNNEEYLVDHVRYNADFFSAMDGLDMPGMDVIGPAGDWHRLPDSMVPKLTSSAAHTRGKLRSMSETFGAAGWSLAPEEMRRIADWLSVRGVTRIVPHAFYYSIAGERYHECPPSLFFQSPHWPAIVGLIAYLTRWTWLLENTQPCAQLAVYYPIEAVRAATSPQVPPSLSGGLDEATASEAGRIGLAMRNLTDALFRAQVDFDVLDDTALLAARLDGPALCLHGRRYAGLLLPAGPPSPRAQAVIAAAAAAGVQVIDGAGASDFSPALPWRTVGLEPAAPQMTAMRRAASGGDLLFVVNEGELPYAGNLCLTGSYRVTEWDLASGLVASRRCEVQDGQTRLSVQVLAGASLCLGLEPAPTSGPLRP
jgi:hypothetical protein